MPENQEVAINWWEFGNKHAPALGWTYITFFVFVGLIIYLVRKPLQIYLEARAFDIKRAIEEAKKAKEDALSRMAQYEAKLSALDAEIESMKNEFILRGQQEKAAFEKAAAHLSEQITKEAEENLVSEVRHALLSLKSDMADAVIASARAQLDESEDRAAEASLKSVFNKGVSELHN
jgi:F0F1-type ATP synthase membrane subunit b/b'